VLLPLVLPLLCVMYLRGVFAGQLLARYGLNKSRVRMVGLGCCCY
jgi:hypothetical protein